MGDIIGSPTVVFVLGWKIFGLFLFAKYMLNYARAYVFCIAFQHYSIESMKGPSVGRGIWQVIRPIPSRLRPSRSASTGGWRSCNSYSYLPRGCTRPGTCTGS